MKIAHLSDLHLGGKSPGDPHGTQRLHSFRGALRQLADESPDAMLIAGDTFDSPQIDTALIEATARALDGAGSRDGGMPIVVIPGNHDPSDSNALWRVFKDSLCQDSHVHLVLMPEVLKLREGKLLIEAYPCETRYSPERPWIRRALLPSEAEQAVRVVVAHGTLQGGPVPEGEMEAYPFTQADVAALQADYVALGHFHGVYPQWPGGEETRATHCYCGTHEPDEFNRDSGWGIIAIVEKGQTARLRRVRVGHRQWRLVEILSPLDLPKLDELRAELEKPDAEPGRFVIRLKVAVQARLSPEEGSRLERLEEGLRVLGAYVERQGEFQTWLNVETLELSGLASGAVKQALLALQQELAQATDTRQREVLAAALQLGWEQFER